MITRFHVQNYKALRDVTLDLTPVHVLIGPNDSGKTSLLQALAALCRSVEHPIASAFLGSWQGRELVSYGASDPISLSVQFDDSELRTLDYGFECAFANKGRDPHIRKEYVMWQRSRNIDFPLFGGGTRTVVDVSVNTAVQMQLLVAQDKLEDAACAAKEVHSSLSNYAFHRWEPRFLSLPVAPDSQRKFRMDHNGFGLALCLDDILGFDRNRFGRLEDRFREIFPQVRAIRLMPEPAYRSPVNDPSQITVLQKADGKGIHFEFEGQSTLVPASQVSDGLLIVLAYLALLYLPEPPRVLLIEEPENGIHPGRLKEIIRILKQLVSEQSHTQVLMTTHSPYVLHEFQPEEVTICVREQNGEVKTRRLSDSKAVQEQMDFFSLGEIWTMEGDEALIQPVTDENVDDPTVTPSGEVQPAS